MLGREVFPESNCWVAVEMLPCLLTHTFLHVCVDLCRPLWAQATVCGGICRLPLLHCLLCQYLPSHLCGPLQTALSASYSMGANLRTNFADTGATGPTPGPGSYEVAQAALKEGQM